jgi:hypothetical protein
VETVLDVLVVLAQVLGTIAVLVVAVVIAAGVLEAILAVGQRIVALIDPDRPAPSATEVAPSYWLTLFVRFDEESGRFCPSVQVRGNGELTMAWIRVELVDGDGAVRLMRRKRLAKTAIGTELALTAFAVPDGVSRDEVLGWYWDIVIEDEKGERARWREQPRPAEHLNAEAELTRD